MKKNNLILMFISLFLLNSLVFATEKQSISDSQRLQEVKKRIVPGLNKLLNENNLKLGQPVFMRIFKQNPKSFFLGRSFNQTAELEVWIKPGQVFKLFKTYPVCYFSGQLGPKLKTGDGQSPEGFYNVTSLQMNPDSKFHLSFNLGYPNAYDLSHNRTGSLLMVHGNCVSVGCFAMTDKYIEEIYVLADEALRHGQRSFGVHIFPFRMTEENMTKCKSSQWVTFWQNLKEGYVFFEKYKIPPVIKVQNKRYMIQGN